MQRTINELNRQFTASKERYRGIFEDVVVGDLPDRSGRPPSGDQSLLVQMFGFEEVADYLASVHSMAALFANGAASAANIGKPSSRPVKYAYFKPKRSA